MAFRHETSERHHHQTHKLLFAKLSQWQFEIMPRWNRIHKLHKRDDSRVLSVELGREKRLMLPTHLTAPQPFEMNILLFNLDGISQEGEKNKAVVLSFFASSTLNSVKLSENGIEIYQTSEQNSAQNFCFSVRSWSVVMFYLYTSARKRFAQHMLSEQSMTIEA